MMEDRKKKAWNINLQLTILFYTIFINLILLIIWASYIFYKISLNYKIKKIF